ncbi:DMT family transporter [Limibacillus halophilus]|uniref:Drug/metabolite transporter (DMT)-like permease n=1 Tax=Limibacillus halophilus TaxID=1579333 RepID=A0A839SVN0_9PROT|nr:DMT family transporter [Limibacillus halophilus]MBB3065536.1 drug/metabolite transporter (DMT)-like permease [Limibacillus halophilus]
MSTPISDPGQSGGASDSEGRDPLYLRGLAFVLGASLFNSSIGFLIRVVEEADGWTLLFYRSIAFVIFMLGFLAFRHGPTNLPARFRAIGYPGVLAGVMLGISFTGFIFALLNTTVANVVFIGASSPFLAAFFAYVALRERLSLKTWMAMGLALVGVAVMVGDGLTGGGILGIGLALLTITTFAIALVALRSGRRNDMRPATCLAGVFALCAATVMADTLVISAHDLAVACTMGVVQLGLQYAFLTAGTRYVPAGEVALVGRLQLVLAPLWAWLAVGEVPSDMTFIGGIVIVTALVFHGFNALRGTSLRV